MSSSQPTTGSFAGNDTVTDLGTLFYTLRNSPTANQTTKGGTVILNLDGTFSYTPPPTDSAPNEPDRFIYDVTNTLSGYNKTVTALFFALPPQIGLASAAYFNDDPTLSAIIARGNVLTGSISDPVSSPSTTFLVDTATLNTSINTLNIDDTLTIQSFAWGGKTYNMSDADSRGWVSATIDGLGTLSMNASGTYNYNGGLTGDALVAIPEVAFTVKDSDGSIATSNLHINTAPIGNFNGVYQAPSLKGETIVFDSGLPLSLNTAWPNSFLQGTTIWDVIKGTVRQFGDPLITVDQVSEYLSDGTLNPHKINPVDNVSTGIMMDKDVDGDSIHVTRLVFIEADAQGIQPQEIKPGEKAVIDGNMILSISTDGLLTIENIYNANDNSTPHRLGALSYGLADQYSESLVPFYLSQNWR